MIIAIHKNRFVPPPNPQSKYPKGRRSACYGRMITQTYARTHVGDHGGLIFRWIIAGLEVFRGGGGMGGREELGPRDGNHTVALLITLIITLRMIIIEAIILWQLMELMCAAESIVLYSAFKPK